MSILFWAPFLFASPQHNTCSTRGVPLLEMTELSETDPDKHITTKIYESGAWRTDTDRGCFDKQELRAIRRAVQRAPWKEAPSSIRCFAYDPNFTEYRVHGRLTVTVQPCSGKTADKRTMSAIALIKQELADELPPPPPPVATDSPLFEITNLSSADRTKHETTTIFESGAWTSASEHGQFDPAELRAIENAVEQAPWKITTRDIRCFAYDPNYTEYRLHGKLVFTEQLCSGKTADDRSMRAIALVKQELAEETAPPTAACNTQGTPLFEIRKHVPDQTIAIYGSGAVTRDGKTSCVDKQTIDTLRDVIQQSPWDTTTNKIVCRAYSPSYTEYLVNGKLEYTARMCGAEKLDEKSLGAIKIVEDTLALKPVGSPKLPTDAKAL